VIALLFIVVFHILLLTPLAFSDSTYWLWAAVVSFFAAPVLGWFIRKGASTQSLRAMGLLGLVYPLVFFIVLSQPALAAGFKFELQHWTATHSN